MQESPLTPSSYKTGHETFASSGSSIIQHFVISTDKRKS